MKRHFLILFSIFLFFGCAKEEKKAPKNLLSDSKMVGVLIDIHLLDEKIKTMLFQKDTALVVHRALQEDIWTKHNITETSFKESSTYYLEEHLTEYETIYKQVIDSIGVLESLEKISK